jgi:hypothetical protein
VVARTVAVD